MALRKDTQPTSVNLVVDPEGQAGDLGAFMVLGKMSASNSGALSWA